MNRKCLLVGFLILAGSLVPSFAIEGLKICVEGTNVVLSWPSVDGSGANYIVQYRNTLDATDSWQTLTSSWPAASGTNVTFFVHSNAVNFPTGYDDGGTNDSGGGLPPSPMVMAAGSTGNAGGVPIELYPPGFDFTGMEIFDPESGESFSGASFNASSFLLRRGGGFQPMDDSGGSGGDTGTPGTGFYQVVQDGVKILDSNIAVLTNGCLSNNVTVTFETGNAANDGTGTNILGTLSCAVLLIDGTRFPGDGGVVQPAGSGGALSFDMDTGYLQNGTHYLQVAATYINPDNSNGNNVNITRYSDYIQITVSNIISYPNWEPEIGEVPISAYFAQTIYTDVDWQIDIYDVSNNLAKTLTGHTPDGNIEAYWDMVDTNGITRTNADVDTEFSTSITVYDAPVTKKAPKKKQRHRDWPDHGIWTISYLDFFKFEYSANNYMISSINSYANTAAKYGGYYLYYPQPGQTNDIGQTYPLRYQKTNHPDPTITIQAEAKDQILLEDMLASTNSRNFFYDGHGDPSGIDDISTSEFAHFIKHRYRFVMIDACSSANGDLDTAFGIHGPGRYAQTYYHNTGIRPGAYCGYTEDVTYATGGPVTHNGVTYDDTIPDDVPFFITNFLFYWDLEGYRLTDAIQTAADNLPNPGGPGQREYHWQIYGYDDMRIDEDNHASDTW